MAVRVPRLLVLALIALLATAGLTLAAQQTLVPTTSPSSGAPLPQKRATLVVPDLRNQAFVFAKGALQDAGFAWRVAGSVHGYSANTVATQSPAAGARIYDTGAPLVTLTLVRNKRYPQKGSAEDRSPYRATAVAIAEPSETSLEAPPASSPAPAAAPATTTPATTTPVAPAPASTTPASTTPATTTPASTTPAAAPAANKLPARAPAASTAHAAQAPGATPAAKPVAKPAAKPVTSTASSQARPPAFLVAGAPKEPLDEISLPQRARALDSWLASHQRPTNKNVKYWLYQNEWIVTGARFGWWHGADALQTLIRVDRRAQSLWGVGSKSASVAAGALSEVKARSR
jgi:hypothetical protein